MKLTTWLKQVPKPLIKKKQMVQLQMMMNQKYVQQVLEASSLYSCKKSNEMAKVAEKINLFSKETKERKNH